jgi:hypothetical protein
MSQIYLYSFWPIYVYFAARRFWWWNAAMAGHRDRRFA